MTTSSRTAYVYVDGWNFYHAINVPGLHPLGFCNFRKLAQYLLGVGTTVVKVSYFSARDYHQQLADEQQGFWLRALRSAKIEVAELGRFEYIPEKGKAEEKTTDVRLALQLVDDARTGTHEVILLVSADADFLPALQRAKLHGKTVKVAFPPGLQSKGLQDLDPFPYRIEKNDLEYSLLDAEGTTERGEPLTKALDYGWACRVKGRVVYGHPTAEAAHWRRRRPK